MIAGADPLDNRPTDISNPAAPRKLPPIEFRPEKNFKPGEVLINREQIDERIKVLAAAIYEDYKDRKLVLLTVLKGARVFSDALQEELCRLGLTNIEEETTQVLSYAGTDSSGELEWVKEPNPKKIQDEDVLLVEDIVDTGLTLSGVLVKARQSKPRSLRSVALLSKPIRRQIEIDADYTGFEIDDHFVVGFGLDFNQQFRDDPELWIYGEGIPPEEDAAAA